MCIIKPDFETSVLGYVETRMRQVLSTLPLNKERPDPSG